MKTLLASTAVLALTAGATSAADLYTPPVEAVVYESAPAFSWTGFYLGLHGGYGWADGSAEYADDIDCPDGPIACAVSLDPEGAFVGGQMGFNWQWGQFVLGLEGDYSFASLSDDGDAGSFPFASHVDLDIDAIATVQARFGWAFGQWLPFATVGWGWADAERSVYNPALPGNGGSDSNWHDGWTVGAGLEYAITNNWTVKGEYRYYALGSENYSVPTIGGGGTDVDLDMHTVRFGVNYKF